MSPFPPHLRPPVAPVARPEAVVVRGPLRASFLSPRLVRVEHDPAERFEDRASLGVWFRHQPVPDLKVQEEDDATVVRTTAVELRLPRSGRFEDVRAMVVDTGAVWDGRRHPAAGRNLWGTIRSLDRTGGIDVWDEHAARVKALDLPMPLAPHDAIGPVSHRLDLDAGVLGRDGYAVVDDSSTPLLGADGHPSPRPEGAVDAYLFAHGHDVQGALDDLRRVAGPVPLVPRWALGVWWSRNWSHTDEELLEVVGEFAAHGVQLAVCVLDMDWHVTEPGNGSSGWGGYTWERSRFPDPAAFLRRLHAGGTRAALNLHPACGVWPHEEAYAGVCAALGRHDDGAPVPFDLTDAAYAAAYFEHLHHPHEDLGVDLWWIDWQQGTTSTVSGLDPLWWLNHLHALDRARDGRRRPAVLSRWGGLGNHRYPLGFTGDTEVSWASLALEARLTPTAANVGYGWTSHDIGGFYFGEESDELYVRWLQFGVFSPVLRLHSAKLPFHERRPWARGPAAEGEGVRLLRERTRWIPYVYAMAWRDHDAGRALCRPMYHEHPQAPEAYEHLDQYWFGSELVVAPHVAPVDPETGHARRPVWLPDGLWFDFHRGRPLRGGRVLDRHGDLRDVPVFARAGALVPLDAQPAPDPCTLPTRLDLVAFPGADGRFVLYEDDGTSEDHRHGRSATTVLEQRWSGAATELEVAAPTGTTDLLPATRTWRVELRGVAAPTRVEVRVDGEAQAVGWRYHEAEERLAVDAVAVPTGAELRVAVATDAPSLVGARDRRRQLVREVVVALPLPVRQKLMLWLGEGAVADGAQDPTTVTPLTEAQADLLRWQAAETPVHPEEPTP